MTMKQIAEKIPHEYREKILKEWLPKAKVRYSNKYFLNLFNAYFIYIDPDGVKKSDCPKCLANIYKNWQDLQPYLVEVEQEYNILEQL